MITVRNQWFAVYEEVEKEYTRKLNIAEKAKERLLKRALKAESRLNDAKDKITEQRRQMYELETQLEEEKGKNLKLRAQINRDYENSSIPSSKTIRHKKIANSREKTGRRPGGQSGHKGHCRKKQIPTTAPVLLPPPQKVLEDPNFKKTSKVIVKQLVNVRTVLEVTEYHADVYYNAATGERTHAEFPAGVVDDVNYGGSIKAFLFLLNNDCCTSIDKSRKFLSDLTGGKLNISKGMINKLSREFATKTEQEQKKIYADLLLAPVMHTDCTNAKENGKNVSIFVCATPEGKAELAFKVADRIISIQECDDGYDYSIMDENYREIDGGVYDNPDVDIRYALLDIVDDLTSHPDTNGAKGNISSDAKWEQLDFDEVSEQMDIANLPGPEVFMSRVVMEFKAKTEECFRKIGNMSATDIEEHIAEYVNAKLYENDFDAEIIGVVISGSRCRGLEGKNSDLDVVVQLSGNEREDDLFNLLHEDKFRIGGVLVDINPITEYKTGTLEEYLPGVEKYLEEKAMQMGKKLSVTADLQSKKMQVAGEKKKETKRDCKKSETVI